MALKWEVVKEGCACQLYALASAALGTAKRQGTGKMRHINVRTLWLQEKAVQKVLEYQKFRGEDNPADGLTKHVRQELAQQYARATRTRLGLDRADIILKRADSCRQFLQHVLKTKPLSKNVSKSPYPTFPLELCIYKFLDWLS